MMDRQLTGYGIAAALYEINRRIYANAEERLAEKMKPARLAPLQGADAPTNFSHVNGDAASTAVVARMRATNALDLPPQGFIA